MEILALKLVLAASVIVLADAQFKMAKHGASCVDFSPFEPMKVCDHDVGLDCLGSKKGGKSKKAGAVCSCYGSFVYDWVSKECRRKVGDFCRPYTTLEQLQKRSWSEKCQDDAVCSAKGVCVCKPGLVLGKFNHSCVKPLYIRGRGWR